MSLDVSPQLLAEAENGEVRDQDLVETVRSSLPYAYDLIAPLADELRSGTAEFTDNQTPPPSEKERGQLLRALSSDAIRGSLERHPCRRLPPRGARRRDPHALHLAARADPQPVAGAPRLLSRARGQ